MSKALEERYRRAVGKALEYGILTYMPGTGRPGDPATGRKADLGPWEKSLGDLEAEIRAAEGRTGPTFEHFLAEALGLADGAFSGADLAAVRRVLAAVDGVRMPEDLR